jgi:hypothetical protein
MDSMTEEEYRQVYDQLRDFDELTGDYGVSLREFCDIVESEFSHGLWYKYQIGEARLNRTMRNELRRAINRVPLPPTIEQALQDVDPNAVVLAVGDRKLDRVILVSGDDQVYDLLEQGESEALPMRGRLQTVRLFLREDSVERRRVLGISWREVIEAGLQALEK